MHVPDPPAGRSAQGVGRTGQPAERVQAWQPAVPGVAEVLHARFVRHVYPAHTHDAWTLLVVEHGAIRFDLERAEHGAVAARVTVLPPQVAHTGRAGTAAGFRKQVLYLDDSVLGAELVGAAVDGPGLTDPLLRRRVGELHRVLAASGEELEAESRLALIRSRLHEHLLGRQPEPLGPSGSGLARQLRELLDSRTGDPLTLREAGATLHAHPDALVRAFTAAFGLPPHRYVIGRRVDAARRLLLAGQPLAEVAAVTGFHDQSHLTRHFTRQIGTTPGRYARGGPARPE